MSSAEEEYEESPTSALPSSSSSSSSSALASGGGGEDGGDRLVRTTAEGGMQSSPRTESAGTATATAAVAGPRRTRSQLKRARNSSAECGTSKKAKKKGRGSGGAVGLGSSNPVVGVQFSKELIECTVCFETMYPPIYQCTEGHLVCYRCKPKCVGKCPTCRVNLGNIRNRALEQCIGKVILPCRYKGQGCGTSLEAKHMFDHVKDCPHRDYECPRSRSTCTWAGKLVDVVPHLKARHKLQVGSQRGNIKETFSNPDGIANPLWEGPIIKCEGEDFFMHFEQRNNGQYSAFVRHIGEPDKSNQFKYHLQVEGVGRVLRWEGVPRSIRVKTAVVQKENDCLVVEESLGLRLSGVPQDEIPNDDVARRKKIRLLVRGKVYKKDERAAEDKDSAGESSSEGN